MMSKQKRWQQKFTNFQKALKKLQEGVELSKQRPLSELERQGVIQAFKFTYEIAWLTLKDYLTHQGFNEIVGPRDTIREAFSSGLIQDGEGWMEMMKSRNQTVHTYEETVAATVMKEVSNTYTTLFELLKNNMHSLA